MNKKQNNYKFVMVVLITAILSILISTVIVYNCTKGNLGTKYVFVGNKNETDYDRAIASIREIIDDYYLGDLPEENDLVEGAIKGYVEALDDEYTEYMTADGWSEYKEEALGNYIGIGVVLRTMDKGQEIYQVIKNSPAQKAELEVGDIITKVDDIIATKENMEEVTNYIKSKKEGTKFKVELLRGEETISKEVESETVRILQIDSEMLDDNIGYMYIATFDMGVAEDFS